MAALDHQVVQETGGGGGAGANGQGGFTGTSKFSIRRRLEDTLVAGPITRPAGGVGMPGFDPGGWFAGGGSAGGGGGDPLKMVAVVVEHQRILVEVLVLVLVMVLLVEDLLEICMMVLKDR